MKKLLTLLLAAFMLPAFAGEFPEGSPKFGTDFEAAKKAAAESGKPIIVVFSAVWCPPCQSMKKNVYPSADVKPLHDKFVWAYLDVDDEKNAKIAEQYKVRGIPHIQFLGKDAKDLGNQVGGMAPAEFAGLLTKVSEKAAAK
jgi:thioredoxin-related protein